MDDDTKKIFHDITTSSLRLKHNSTGEYHEGVDTMCEIMNLHLELYYTRVHECKPGFREFCHKKLKEIENNEEGRLKWQ